MSAVEKRMASRDPIKKLTYRYQYWLAHWRKLGGDSSDEHARYMRQKLKEIRFKKS